MKQQCKQWLLVAVSKQLLGWLLLSSVCLSLVGCWDQRELQNRHIALAVAIDVADGSETGVETFVQPYGGKQFRLSVQLLELAPTQGEQGGSSGNQTYVISNTGRSLLEITRDMYGQLGKVISWEHIQVIIISEAALEAGGLDQLLDWFMRDSQMRWRIHVYVTPGKASPILEYQPPSGEANGIFLANIARNNLKDPHIASSRSDLGFTVIKLDNKIPFVLPKIELADGIIKVSGVAVMKNNRLAGYLNEDETAGGRYILGVEKSAIITTHYQDHPEHILAFELFHHDTRLQAHVSGDTIYYTLDITMYGQIGEMGGSTEPSDYTTGNPDYIRKLELQFAEEVKQRVELVLKRLQEQGADGLNFGRALKIQYPKKWEEVKERWNEEIFPKIPMVVSVNVTIFQVGEHK